AMAAPTDRSSYSATKMCFPTTGLHSPNSSFGARSGGKACSCFDERKCLEKGIEVLLGCSALAIDPQRHLVATSRAGDIQYGQALIATGASAVRMKAPGNSLAGIHRLRTLPDAEGIRNTAAHAKRAVVVGASFLGLEVAASLTQMQIAVTVVEQE